MNPTTEIKTAKNLAPSILRVGNLLPETRIKPDAINPSIPKYTKLVITRKVILFWAKSIPRSRLIPREIIVGPTMTAIIINAATIPLNVNQDKAATAKNPAILNSQEMIDSVNIIY